MRRPVQQSGPRLYGWGLCAALVALCAGCAPFRNIDDEVRRSRTDAFESWRRTRAGRAGSILTLTKTLTRTSYEARMRRARSGGGRDIVLKGTLDTASAVLLAMGNNKRLRAALQDKEIALGQVTEAWAEALPKLDFVASYTRLDKVPGVNFGGVNIEMGFVNNYALELVLTQPIFRGGATAAGIRAARIFSHLADQQVAGTVQDVMHETRRGYCDVLLSRRLVRVSEGDLRLAKAHLRDVEARHAAELAPRYDVLRAGVEVRNVEAELIKRQNALRLGMAALFKTLGVSQDSQVELSGGLTYDPVSTDLEECAERALRQRPEILQAELTARLNEEAVIDARSGAKPTVDATFTHRYARPDPHDTTQDQWDREWNAALVLKWPLFDGFATRARVRQARAELRRSRILLADAEEQVLLEVRQAILSIEDARKLVTSQQENLKRAREALRLAIEGHKVGVRSELERRDAEQALSVTESLYYQAVHAHERAKLALERAVGMLKDQNAPGKPGR